MTLYISESDSKQCRWRCKLQKWRQDIGIKTTKCLHAPRLAFDKFLLVIYFWCVNKANIDFCKNIIYIIYYQAVLSIFQAICVKFALTKFSKTAQKLVVIGKLGKMTNDCLPEEKTRRGEYCLQLG